MVWEKRLGSDTEWLYRHTLPSRLEVRSQLSGRGMVKKADSAGARCHGRAVPIRGMPLHFDAVHTVEMERTKFTSCFAAVYQGRIMVFNVEFATSVRLKNEALFLRRKCYFARKLRGADVDAHATDRRNTKRNVEYPSRQPIMRQHHGPSQRRLSTGSQSRSPSYRPPQPPQSQLRLPLPTRSTGPPCPSPHKGTARHTCPPR